ncbi:MAG: ABC transporter ATP-binding protein [Proteobacteria bacterium]|nr:ABC transporter ATP-binding protein [Pseudomonadota bacterium]
MLSIRRVVKSFDSRPGGSVPVLAGIDLDIASGEFFCLLGGSGCGKTTLLNILAGFEAPSAGEISLDGAAINGAGPDRVVFFQNADAALFPWLTAEENVAFGLRIKGMGEAACAPIAEQWLRLVGLWEHRGKFPQQLSGGMKQRIQIARGLAIDPAMLLMDEPFAALDAITRRLMHAELLRIWSATSKTVVFVTHDVAEAVILADRIGVMTRGPSARIKAVIPVELPRPRDPGHPRFAEAYGRIEALLMPEAQA